MRAWIRNSLALLLSICVPFSSMATALASTDTEDAFIPHTTDAFDEEISDLAAAKSSQNILAYDPDLGELAAETARFVGSLEAAHPGAIVIVIPAREKQHVTISVTHVSDPYLPGGYVEPESVEG